MCEMMTASAVLEILHFVIQFILYKCFSLLSVSFFAHLYYTLYLVTMWLKKDSPFSWVFLLHCALKNKFITPWLSCWSCLISMYIHNFYSTYSIWSMLLGSIFSKLSIHCFFSHIEIVSSHALLAREYISSIY